MQAEVFVSRVLVDPSEMSCILQLWGGGEQAAEIGVKRANLRERHPYGTLEVLRMPLLLGSIPSFRQDWQWFGTIRWIWGRKTAAVFQDTALLVVVSAVDVLLEFALRDGVKHCSKGSSLVQRGTASPHAAAASHAPACWLEHCLGTQLMTNCCFFSPIWKGGTKGKPGSSVWR